MRDSTPPFRRHTGLHSLLVQADGLASEHYGVSHPDQLATLLDLHEALGAELMKVWMGVGNL